MTDIIKLPAGLVNAEEFLDRYGVDYEPLRLEGKRIPLMLRFRFYLEAVELEGRIVPGSALEDCEEAVRWCLERALKDVGADGAGPAYGPEGTVGTWAAGCLNTSACAACKSGCS